MQIHFHRHFKEGKPIQQYMSRTTLMLTLIPVYVIYKLDSVKHFCYRRIIHSNLDKVRTV